jgi:hypothetical protein
VQAVRSRMHFTINWHHSSVPTEADGLDKPMPTLLMRAASCHRLNEAGDAQLITSTPPPASAQSSHTRFSRRSTEMVSSFREGREKRISAAGTRLLTRQEHPSPRLSCNAVVVHRATIARLQPRMACELGLSDSRSPRTSPLRPPNHADQTWNLSLTFETIFRHAQLFLVGTLKACTCSPCCVEA